MTYRTRRFVPVPPEQRPRRERRGVRVIVTDGESVLLVRDSDPGLPGTSWYGTPGGGIDPGETPLAAAVRELAEETGLVVAASELAGPVLRRTVVHGYSDQVLTQREEFFVLRTTRFVPDLAGHTADEQLTIQGLDWLPLAALSASAIPVWPVVLGEVLRRAEAGEPVWEMGTVEESTLPV